MRLYGGREKIFPEFVLIDDVEYAVNADFRNILRIFAMMKDGNISDGKKIYKLFEWFVCEAGGRDLDFAKVIKSFGDFVTPEKAANQGKNGENFCIQEERQFCYEFDGEEIYAGFLCEYKIDLFECEFLHWHKFRIMLANLSDGSSFKKKIALRFLELNDFSREKSGFYDVLQAWESVQLPREDNACGDKDVQEFENFWERVK